MADECGARAAPFEAKHYSGRGAPYTYYPDDILIGGIVARPDGIRPDNFDFTRLMEVWK